MAGEEARCAFWVFSGRSDSYLFYGVEGSFKKDRIPHIFVVEIGLFYTPSWSFIQ
jgi:hypothetical protein